MDENWHIAGQGDNFKWIAASDCLYEQAFLFWSKYDFFQHAQSKCKAAGTHLEREEKPPLLFQTKPSKFPNQLLIKSIDKPQNLLFYVLESFSFCIFFTFDKCVGIILMTLPPKGYSRTRSMPKGNQDDCKYGSASAHGKAKAGQLASAADNLCVWGEGCL